MERKCAFNQKQEQASLDNIQHKIIVLSGKGGVGKSTVAINLAAGLVQSQSKVGLLDIDIHGPSIPTMLGISEKKASGDSQGIDPVTAQGLSIMSVGFFLQHPDSPIIYRGPAKASLIRQFVTEVKWGDLDYLIIDAPPGTGDEPLSLCQLLDDISGAVIVTTPQEVSQADVRKSVEFCRKIDLPIIGIIENMKGFVCPHCGELTHIYPERDLRKSGVLEDISYLGSIPIEPQIGESGDTGVPYAYQQQETKAMTAIQDIVKKIGKALPI